MSSLEAPTVVSPTSALGIAQTGSNLSPPAPRKRHVVSRERNGCLTCRRRHTRCDKTKPSCANCTRLGFSCEGYINRVTFRDQTTFITQKFQSRKKPPGPKQTTQTTVQTPLSPHDTANISSATETCQSSPISLFQEEDIMADESWLWTALPLTAVDNTLEQDSPSSVVDESLAIWPTQTTESTDAHEENDYDFSFAFDTFAAQDNTASIAMSIPATMPVVCVHSAAQQCFQFPNDPDLFNRLLTNGITGLTAIVPISSLFRDESFTTPHLYRAALSVTSLCAPPTLTADLVNKQQALRHYSMSIRALHAAFPVTTAEAFLNCSLQDIFVWFLTRLLLANCDLRLGHLAAWRAHLRAAGRILSAYHGRFMQREHGRQLAWAFARMALLVELQDRDMAVTGTLIMNPGVASDLSTMVERSDSARDQLLVLIRRIGNVELKYRYRPQEASKWIAKMQKIDSDLTRWQQRLPPSELPVDTGVQESVTFPLRQGLQGTAKQVDVRPLTFPNALDSHFAAVNYAHFLCARMRARTRYGLDGAKEAPQDTGATVMHICRIAAGLSAVTCSRAEAFGHGILPAIAGAYYWTTDPSMQNWIWKWLGVYEAEGAREGIWNVHQTRRLMVFLDEETERRRTSQGTWEIVCARIHEDEDVLDEDSGVLDRAIRREERMLLEEDESASFASSLVLGRCVPFQITLYSNSTAGWATHSYTVV